MIFKLLDDNKKRNANNIQLINKPYKDIKRDYKSGHGPLSSLFINQISKNDIEYIEQYTQLLSKGVPTGQAWSKTIAKCSVAAKQHVLSSKNQISSLTKLTTSMKGTTLASKAGSVALKAMAGIGGMLASFAIDAAISKISEAIYKMVHAEEIAMEKSKELTATYISQKDSLDDYITRYKNLIDELDNESLSTTQLKSVKEELLVLQKDITKSYGDEARGIDLLNGKYENQLLLLRDLDRENAKDYVALNEEHVESDKKYLNKKISGTLSYAIDLSPQVESLLKTKDYLSVDDVYDTSYFKINYKTSRLNSYEQLKNLYHELDNNFGDDKTAKELKSFISKELNTFNKEKIETSISNVKTYTEAYIKANDASAELYYGALEAVEKYNQAVYSGKGVKESYNKFNEIKNKVSEHIELFPDSIEVFDNIFNQAINIKPDISNIDNLKEDIRNTYDQLATLDSIINGVQNNQSLSTSEVRNLIDLYPQLADSIIETSDGYSIEISKLEELREQIHKTKEAQVDAQIDETLLTIETTKDRITAYKSEIESLKDLQTKTSNGILSKLLGSLIQKSIDDNTLLLDEATEDLEALEKKYAGLSVIKKLLGLTDKEDNPNKPGDPDSYNEDKLKEPKQIDWTANSIQNLRTELDKLNSELDNTTSWSKQLKIQKQIIDSTKELSNAYAESLGDYKSYYDKVSKGLPGNYKKAIESGKHYSVEDFKGKDREIQFEKVEKAQNAWRDYKQAELDYNNSIYKQQEEQDKLLQLQINKYDAIIDKNNSKLNNSTHSYKEQNKIQRNLLDAQKKSYELQIKLAKTDEERVKLQSDLKNLISENAKQQFDNIEKYYSNKLSLNNSKQQLLQSQIDSASEKGYQVGKSFYEKQKTLYKDYKDKLLSEKEALQGTLDDKVKTGQIKKYSQEWYDMVNTIYGVNHAIQETSTSIDKCNNSLRQLSWDRFDNLLTKFQSITSESDFLINLLSNEKLVNDEGGLNDKGLATIGQHGINYNTYMAESDEIAKELKTLDKNSSDINVQQRIQDLTKSRYDAIQAAQTEKQSILSLVKEGVQAEIDAFSELISKKKEALDSEKNLYEYQKTIANSKKSITLIQKQINSLSGDDSDEAKKKLRELRASLSDAQTQLDDTVYNKNIENQKEYLDNQLNSYKDSMETYLSDNETMFNDAIKQINSKSDTIAETINTTAKNVGYTISSEITNAWTKSGETISNYNKTFTTNSVTIIETINNIKNAWQKANEEYDKYAKNTVKSLDKSNSSTVSAENQTYKDILGSDKVSTSSNGQTALNQYVTSLGYAKLSYQDMYELGSVLGVSGIKTINDVDGSKKTNSTNRTALLNALKHKLIEDFLGKKSYSYDKKSDDFIKTTKLNQYLMESGYKKLTPSQQVQLAKLLGIPDIDLGNYLRDVNSKKIVEGLKNSSFVTGGIVSEINQVVKSNGDDALATVQKKELILDTASTNYFKEFVKVTPEYLDTMNSVLSNSFYLNPVKPSARLIESIIPKSIGDLNLTINAPNVTDTDSLIKELKSPRIQSIIQHTAWDTALGKGQLNVTKY
ncbi:hypothetical protein [Lachnoclostridium sp.]|uniref:hypothetical protein n=1 Tax=Lachnoclostridium sp. TaxID=2028282 RepID=UPI0028A040D2|nr:hypothetical protein [Lachnoclostridium sp.]